MKKLDHAALADTLFRAESTAQAVPRLTQQFPKLPLADAYHVQRILLERHLAKGNRLVGRKMGLTSRPKMQQMGVHEPIHGFLLAGGQVPDSGEIALAGRIHPRIEPEIAFILKRELRGRPSLAEALACVDGVCGALEVIDSRFENFEFQLPDVVADNGSFSAFLLGGVMVKPSQLDLGNLGIVVEANGKPQVFGSSAAILGHPGRSLVALANLLEADGLSLPAGSVVIAGAATAAFPLAPGMQVRATFQNLGRVEARCSA